MRVFADVTRTAAEPTIAQVSLPLAERWFERLGRLSVARDAEDLRRAERLVQGLRWLAILSWIVLFPGTPTWPASSTAILSVFAATLVYAAICHVLVHRVGSVFAVSVLTTIADTVAVAAIVSVTGGLASPILPVFSLTVLSTAIRFGMTEAFAIATLDALHVILIGAAIDGASVLSFAIGEKLYLLYFVALFGGLLSSEARRQQARAMEEGRRANRLLRRVLEADEVERRRIAGELHDRMGKRFFDLYYDLRQCRSVVGDDDAVVREYFERLEQNARECAGEIRSLTNELRPSVLDDFGFVEALKEFVLALEARGEFEVALSIDEPLPPTSPEVGLALLRVLQEAVLNARKHASARRLNIRIARVAEGGVRLAVGDDGVGFDPEAIKSGHYGLLYMRERIEACGGRLAIRRGERGGSVVDATVPASE